MEAVSKSNVLGIVALIGAILMVVGVFLAWVNVEVAILGSTNYSGWQVYTDDTFKDADYNYAPLVTLIAGIVAIITAIVPIVLKTANIGRILGAVSLILGIVSLILIFMFNGTMDSITLYGYTLASTSAGMGLWIALVGSVLLVLGGILDIAKKYTA